MLLALDTSTPQVSVAVHDGSTVAYQATARQPMKHGEQLAPLIAAALRTAGAARSDLTEVAVGVGPGPFTGLRVGLVTARTLGLALGIPVRGVVSLDVLAARAREEGVEGALVATIDARRKELFWAAYDRDGRRVRGPEVSRPADLAAVLAEGSAAEPNPDANRSTVLATSVDTVVDTVVGTVVGSGPRLYPEVFPTATGPEGPDAATLAVMVAEGRATVVPPEPIYLRRPDVTMSPAHVSPRPLRGAPREAAP